MGRAWWGVWLAVWAGGCGEEPCAAGQRRCVEEERQVCVSGSGGTRWEGEPCPEHATCLGEGRCGILPLLPCDPAVAMERCDASNRVPGVCEDGVWLYDVDRTCRTPGETCITGLDQGGGTPVPRALCVLDPPSLCTPGSSSGFCHNDLAATCSPVGYLVLVQDCRELGRACRQGACVP
ncbi:hypothetical protein KBD49_13875 [Myxococcota bacterium]|nr:hypothetical protein [Myxococcota bacterium]